MDPTELTRRGWLQAATAIGLMAAQGPFGSTIHAQESADPAVRDVGARKQLFIDERFVAERQGVELVVNPPLTGGPINVAAETAPCVVEHEGICHLYQGLNGRTSLWTSTDGLQWKARGQIVGIDDNGPRWTSIHSVFIDPRVRFATSDVSDGLKPPTCSNCPGPTASTDWCSTPPATGWAKSG